MIVRAATPHERALLAGVVGVHLTPEARGIVAMNGATVRGGVLYDGWTATACQVHMATSGPMAWRYLLPAAFAYPFEEARCSVLIGNVRESNTASVNLTQHLGFTEACRIPDAAGPGEALIIFTMRREDCRYLGGVHGKSGAGAVAGRVTALWTRQHTLSSAASANSTRTRIGTGLPPPRERAEHATEAH